MLRKTTDLDTVHLLRIAAWMWLGYLLALTAIDAYKYAGPARVDLAVYHLRNGAVAAVFLGLAYWPAVQKYLGRAYVPCMLLMLSGFPIVSSHFFMPRLPPGPMTNVEGMTMRLLPILFLGLVITAWQYRWPVVVWFALGTAGLEIAILLAFPPLEASAQDATLFVTLVRSVSLLVVGYFISRLIGRLQAQQEELAQANARVVHYASTLERLTISRERNRLAHELHDTLAHTLSGLTVQLETIKAYWDVEPETARRLLAESLATTRSGLDETRRALKALRASPLDDLGLALALRDLAENAAARGKLSLELAVPETLPILPPDVEQGLYRVAQEALENVVRHACARRLEVKLAVEGRRVVLQVRDDGLGLAAGQADAANHFGLAGMRERAQLVGGELALDSRPGHGTLVQLAIEG